MKGHRKRHLIVLTTLALGWATAPTPARYDAVIRNGLFCDGSGSAPRKGDIAITGAPSWRHAWAVLHRLTDPRRNS